MYKLKENIKARILIAEEDAKFRQLIAASLENANFEVFQVASSEEVLQMIQTEPIAQHEFEKLQ